MRSKLFVPASRPEFFEKAMRSAADAISFDLEDAVLPARRPEARRTLHAFLDARARTQGKEVVVRVNHVASDDFAADLDAVVVAGVNCINLPKLASGEEVRRGADAIRALAAQRRLTHKIGILVNIESPEGLRRAAEIACADPMVSGVQYGLGDLFAPLRIARTVENLAHVRMIVRMAAAEAGLPVYDTAYTNVADTLGYEREARSARAMGFGGKSCIHPSQIALANLVFTPTAVEITAAQHLLAAMDEPANRGKGAFVLDGRMVDEPDFIAARAAVALAERLNLIKQRDAPRP